MSLTHATRGIAVAPHALAAEDGAQVLRERGNAIEAAIAMAASLSVLYPHMTGLGGDGFWLCRGPDAKPFGIDASGPSGAGLDPGFYRRLGLDAVPTRGPLAAITVAGAVSGWALAYEVSRTRWGGRLPLSRLLAPAIAHAEYGMVVSGSQGRATAGKLAELIGQPGFFQTFLLDGAEPEPGMPLRHPRLAQTLRRLARAGLEDFYRGELATSLAEDLVRVGSPLALADLNRQRAELTVPLSLPHSAGTLYNLGPPTQGVASLMILGLFDRTQPRPAEEGADYVHLLVEATKRAFRVRDGYVGDPRDVEPERLARLLANESLDEMAGGLDRQRAAPWQTGESGDTTWFGAIDDAGRAASVIQSLYHEFGSGVVLDGSGVCWQNRGAAFCFDPRSPRCLRPGRRPFHTLNPALAELKDGRLLVYGTMGGDGQPQTQAAVFTRYVDYGKPLDQAIAAPRWLIGRTWGAATRALKLESRFEPAVVDALKARGHEVELVAAYDEVMGHAGALVHRPDGTFEGASDPRSDGAAVGL